MNHKVILNREIPSMEIFNWCEQYIGEKNLDWKLRVIFHGANIAPTDIVFCFADEAMATLFTLRWK